MGTESSSCDEIKIPVLIQHADAARTFRKELTARRPFSARSGFDELIRAIRQEIDETFYIVRITKNSFIDNDIELDEWRCVTQHIHDYPRKLVERDGLQIIVDDDHNKYVRVPVTVVCPRNRAFNAGFSWRVPWTADTDYKISRLLHNIELYINHKHKPYNFIITNIKAASFLDAEINHNDSDWRMLDAQIRDYGKQNVAHKGLKLTIDLALYDHDVSKHQAFFLCKDMKSTQELCPIYAEIRYLDIFNEKHVQHLEEYQHPNEVLCEYGDQCDAYKRLVEGGYQLKDRAHIQIYRHPPRGRRMMKLGEKRSDHEAKSEQDAAQSDEFEGHYGGNAWKDRQHPSRGRRMMNYREKPSDDEKQSEDANTKAFVFNEDWSQNYALWRPTEQDKEDANFNEKDGFLRLLIKEVIENGYNADLCLTPEDKETDNHSMLSMMDYKLNLLRHKLMGSPLNRGEMLAVLLYTGGDCYSDLCKSQRNGVYHKWTWFDYCLFNAIHKLAKRENASYKIYSGLRSTQLDSKHVQCGYFKTYVSASWMKDSALQFVNDDGLLFEIDESFRREAICCDVSWISKFPDEYEVLIARSVDATFNNYECKVIHVEPNGMQIVSLQPYGERRKKQQRSLFDKSSYRRKSTTPIKEQLDERRKPTGYVRNMKVLQKMLRYHVDGKIVCGFIREIESTLSVSHNRVVSVQLLLLIFAYCPTVTMTRWVLLWSGSEQNNHPEHNRLTVAIFNSVHSDDRELQCVPYTLKVTQLAKPWKPSFTEYRAFDCWQCGHSVASTSSIPAWLAQQHPLLQRCSDYRMLIRIGGRPQSRRERCDITLFDVTQIRQLQRYKSQCEKHQNDKIVVDAFYAQLPALPISLWKTSSIYHNGFILTVGGYNKYDSSSAKAYELDFQAETHEQWKWKTCDTGKWKTDYKDIRDVKLCGIHANNVLMIGGYSRSSYVATNVVNVYQLGTIDNADDMHIKNLPNLRLARSFAGCCYDSVKQRVFVGGGGTGKDQARRTVEFLDLNKAKEWALIKQHTKEYHSSNPAMWVDDANPDIVYIAGAAIVSHPFSLLGHIEHYDLREQTPWRTCKPLSSLFQDPQSLNWRSRALLTFSA